MGAALPGIAGCRYRKVGGTDRRFLDPPTRHPLPSGRGWAEPHLAHADVRLDRPGGSGFLEGSHVQGGILPLPHHVGGGRSGRRVHGPRPRSVLFLLRTDALTALFPHRHLGSRAAGQSGGQVLHLHPGRGAADVGGYRGALLHPRARHRVVHVRLPATPRDQFVVARGLLADAGILSGLRSEAPRDTSSQLAARRAH